MRIGSLFSGIGGLELGLEAAGVGHVVWQVEKDPFCRAVLAKHWPDAERFDDVRTVKGTHAIDCNLDEDCTETGILDPVDVVCGGFPCQDVSDSEGVGLAGARSGLWFEMLRIVRELRPRFVVVENVAALADRGLGTVLGGLSESGYDAIWFPLHAYEFGAAHGRARLFIVAYANGDGRQFQPASRLHVHGSLGDHAHGCGSYPPGPHDGSEAWGTYRSAGGPCPGILRGVDGFPSRLDRARIAANGNAVMPGMGRAVGHVVAEIARRVRP